MVVDLLERKDQLALIQRRRRKPGNAADQQECRAQQVGAHVSLFDRYRPSRSNPWERLAFAEADPAGKLARLHRFPWEKCECGLRFGNAPQSGNMAFVAQTDEELNQSVAPFRPCGWGNTLFGALLRPESPVKT